jgi:hypothetical protein
MNHGHTMPKIEFCCICGRPPHVCDDPECVPANAPLAEKVRFLTAHNEKLRNALRNMVRVYRVADETLDPEAETDRLMALTLGPNA